MDWTEFVLKSIPVILAVLGGIWKLTKSIRGSRARLIADMEILDKLPDDHKNRKIIEKSIEQSLNTLYSSRRNEHLFEQIYGSLVGVGFAAWTIWIVHDGFSWWSLLTGFFSLGGFGLALGTIDSTRRAYRSENQENNKDAK